MINGDERKRYLQMLENAESRARQLGDSHQRSVWINKVERARRSLNERRFRPFLVNQVREHFGL